MFVTYVILSIIVFAFMLYSCKSATKEVTVGNFLLCIALGFISPVVTLAIVLSEANDLISKIARQEFWNKKIF